MAKKYGSDLVIVTILADRAERYFSTRLFEAAGNAAQAGARTQGHR